MKKFIFLIIGSFFLINSQNDLTKNAKNVAQKNEKKEKIDDKKLADEKKIKVEKQDQQKKIIRPKDLDTNSVINFFNRQTDNYKINKENEDKIRNLIILGINFLKSLYQDKLKFEKANGNTWAIKYKVEDYSKIQNKYMNNIIALAWGLFYLAQKKDQGFTGGTIVVEDKDSKLFNFLIEYVKGLNPSVAAGQKNIQYISNNPYAYERVSTHFNEFKNKTGFEQYGIEIRYMAPNGAVGDLQKLLPSNKVHFVFGKLSINNKPYTFIKWEDHGLYGKLEAAKHLAGVFKSKGVEVAKRENVPTQFNTDFKAILKLIKSTDKTKDKILTLLVNQAEKNSVLDSGKVVYPIRTIVTILQKISDYAKQNLDGLSNEIITKANNLLTNIKKNKDLDNLDKRRGQEVIITQDEIYKN